MYQGLLGEKRAREKKEAWIRELEIRDREDEIERKRRALRRQRLAAGMPPDLEEEEEEGTLNTSLVEGEGVRGLLAGRGVLAQAMCAWWGRND